MLEEMKQAGGDVFSIDWRIPIDVAWQKLGYDVAIQGNLDPVVLLVERDLIRAKTVDILTRVGNRPGHIFNLGHGILPETPPENVRQLVEFVHEHTKLTSD
jgi:uroporphyrinogen decarboxylase